MKTWSAFPFAGINQQDARTAIEDQEFYWLENLLPTGKGCLRAIWDAGAPLYVASGNTIVYFQWFNIAAAIYCAVFLSDGTAVQVAYPSGAVTTISSTPGTFYAGGQLPIACQSGEQFLLIANNLTTNDYWIWDGAILYAAGSLGPYVLGDITDGGSGYTSNPTVTVFGGAGSGAVLAPTILNGSVVALTVTNPGTGYNPGDQVQVAFTGGGSDNSAILTAVISGTGNVNQVELIAGGSGYTGVPAIGFTGGGGSGAAAVATVVADVVTAITITNPGSGYTSTPTVTFTGGSGSGASAVAVLSSGTLTSVTVVDGGSNFTGTPLLTISGGGGTGATATAVMTAGAISSVTVTAAGTGYTSPPVIVVGTALNNAAAASIAVMPFGVSGTSIETFLSRVWISNPAPAGPLPTGGTFQLSAPESITDFATADGGDLFTSSDRFLRAKYVALHQSNGFLYALGDSSASSINNVQTSGTTSATTFNYLNVNAQIGATWRDTVCDFGQSILFANANGIQGLYGGTVQRVSKKVNNLFDNAVFPPTAGVLTPSGAVANIHTIAVYLFLATFIDPVSNVRRNVMLGWDEKNWLVLSQTTALTFIGTLEVASSQMAWGTDGTGLYPLFQTPSANLTKAVSTKMFGAERPFTIKETLVLYVRGTDLSTGQAGVPLTATMEAYGIATQVGQQPQLPSVALPVEVQPNFLAPAGTQPVWAGAASAVPGTALGVTITSTAPDFSLSDIMVAYRDVGALFG